MPMNATFIKSTAIDISKALEYAYLELKTDYPKQATQIFDAAEQYVNALETVYTSLEESRAIIEEIKKNKTNVINLRDYKPVS